MSSKCQKCRQPLRSKRGTHQYKECGLDNVFLLNAVCFECKCGSSVLLPLKSHTRFSLLILEELLKKPNVFSYEEFLHVLKTLFCAAEEDRIFAGRIGFKNQDLFKHANWGELDRNSTENLKRSIDTNFPSSNDILINQMCSDQVAITLALRLGFKDQSEMWRFANRCAAQEPIPAEFNARIRELAELALTAPPIYQAYSEFEQEQQKIFIVMPG